MRSTARRARLSEQVLRNRAVLMRRGPHHVEGLPGLRLVPWNVRAD